MSSVSILDRLFSFFQSFPHSMAAQMLPSLLFQILSLVLAVIGWRKHRVLSFLLFIAAYVLTVGGSFFMMAIFYGGSADFGEKQHLFGLITAVGYVSFIINLAGMWYLIYRTRIVVKTELE